MRNANQSFDRALGTLEQWARERGISANGTAEGQANKTIEEANEIVDALRLIEKSAFLTDQGQYEDAEALAEIGYRNLEDALGDTGVSRIMCCHCANRNPVEMLHKGIDEIRDRRGHMGGGGIFYKEPQTPNNTSAGEADTSCKTPPPPDPGRFDLVQRDLPQDPAMGWPFLLVTLAFGCFSVGLLTGVLLISAYCSWVF